MARTITAEQVDYERERILRTMDQMAAKLEEAAASIRKMTVEATNDPTRTYDAALRAVKEIAHVGWHAEPSRLMSDVVNWVHDEATLKAQQEAAQKGEG